MDRRSFQPTGCAAFTVADCCKARTKMKSVADDKLPNRLPAKVSAPGDTSACDGDGGNGRGPGRIVDLCPEDRERVVNLVEELDRRIEENRTMRERATGLEAERSESAGRNARLEREIADLKTSSDEAGKRFAKLERELRDSASASSRAAERNSFLEKKLSRLEEDSANETKKLVRTSATERLAAEAKLNLLVSANEQLEKRLEECRLRNETCGGDLDRVKAEKRVLSREKRTVLAQVGVLRGKLCDVSKDALVFKNKLRQVRRDIALQSKKAPVSVDQWVQTSAPSRGCKCVAPVARVPLNGEESLILKELFFSGGNANGMPPEVEDIFFPSPADDVLDAFRRS